ncbi:VanZ family protein [Candidatus Pacearchaeota archaeon]|nr:VanZ family protein [Candidatus Pacearchaeota archaeon]
MLRWLEKKSEIARVITLVIAIFIFYMSSRTFEGGGGKGVLSYVYHFTIFFILAFFLLIALIKGKLRKEIFFIGIIIAILYGISDEIHQYFVPGRYMDVKDILMNSIGIMFAGILYSLLLFRRNNNEFIL